MHGRICNGSGNLSVAENGAIDWQPAVFRQGEQWPSGQRERPSENFQTLALVITNEDIVLQHLAVEVEAEQVALGSITDLDAF